MIVLAVGPLGMRAGTDTARRSIVNHAVKVNA
jgi:hypothetical protein